MSTTRGPWTFNRLTGQVDCEGGTICAHVGWADNGQAIAALPELLDACWLLTTAQTDGERVAVMVLATAALKKAGY